METAIETPEAQRYIESSDHIAEAVYSVFGGGDEPASFMREKMERYHPEFTAYMPAADPSGVRYDQRPPALRGYNRVRSGDRMGVKEENEGVVPMQTDANPQYAGVTEIRPDARGRHKARRVGISSRIKDPAYAERVGAHEARHVLSERMLDYADVHQGAATLLMETYAEFGEFKALLKEGKREQAEEILRTTPYPGAFKFGFLVDKYYKSDHDGTRGYEAFTRDVFTNRSMAKTLDNLKGNMREAIVYTKAA